MTILPWTIAIVRWFKDRIRIDAVDKSQPLTINREIEYNITRVVHTPNTIYNC